MLHTPGCGGLVVLSFVDKFFLWTISHKCNGLCPTVKNTIILFTINISSDNFSDQVQLSKTNPQQADYLWGTSELYKWKAYTGRETEGVLYKPENFDPKKKYPMIVYLYVRNKLFIPYCLYSAPIPLGLNISFFLSRGHVVIVPDIWDKTG